MKVGQIKLVVGALVVTLLMSASPAVATEAPIIDFCAKKTTGKVRAITEGSCKASERSLGASPIVRGETHPTELNPQFKARFEAAKAAAKKKGHNLAITSGYRSLERQEMLYQRAIKRHGSAEEASKWVLPPEKSNHPWGIAIDINYGVGGTKGKKAAAWLEKNGYQYGLCRRYENEWWHFEPMVTPGEKCPQMEPYAS
jgi:D-alanyl-D-alanine carboxypeptidase